MKYFNLLDEPWIPVRRADGKIDEAGLADVLDNAEQYIELAETVPTNLIALYRLLLVIVHRALTLQFGKWDIEDRVKWRQEGFPENCIRDYLETFRDRFWFFHPVHPFMQVKALETCEETKNKIKPWAQVDLEKACGEAPALFDHSIDELPTELPLKKAMRISLGTLQFIPGGLVKILRTSDNAGPLANSAALLPLGSNLLETLVLALHAYVNETEDKPPWELPPLEISDLQAPPTIVTGINDQYTRLTRAILWRSEPDLGKVRNLLFCVGQSIKESEHAPDPMVSYRKNKQDKYIRIGFQGGRALWRDLPSLVPSHSGKYSIPSKVLSGASDLYRWIDSDTDEVNILVAGIASDQAKILRARMEKTHFDKAFLFQEGACVNLRKQIERAENIYKQLNGICSEMIAESMANPSYKETKSRAQKIQNKGPGIAVYFSRLERGVPDLKKHIALGNIDQAFNGWTNALVDATRKSWEATCAMLGYTSSTFRPIARSSKKLNNLVFRIQKDDEE